MKTAPKKDGAALPPGTEAPDLSTYSRLPLRVLIVEGEMMARLGLRQWLEAAPAFRVCGETHRVCQAEALWVEQQPELAVIDPMFDGGGGWKLLERLAQAQPAIPCVVWFHKVAGAEVAAALRAGARSVILRDEEPDVMLEAFIMAAVGCHFLSPRASRALASHVASGGAGAAEGPAPGGRQEQVFRLLGLGLSLREIAERMGIGAKTVQTYVQRLKLALQLDSLESLRQRAKRVEG